MKEHLQEFIASGDIDLAIRDLLTITQGLKSEKLYQEVVLQSSRFEHYEQSRRSGTTSTEENQILLSKITTALLQIIQKIPNEYPDLKKIKNQPPKSADQVVNIDESPKSRMWKWVVAIGLILAIPAALTTITGYSLKDLFVGSNNAFSVTVLVHGENGKDERILKNQGKVLLDIGDTRESEPINQEGEATFKGLSPSYNGQEARISIIHPQPYFPTHRDSVFILEKNKSIYLEVQLEGMDRINGRVIDYGSETPLDSVRVSVQNTAVYTDEFGWYELEIPPDRQRKFIQVNFYKKGYKMETYDSIAPHTKQTIDVSMEKPRP